jgi:hypothetical protein
MACTPAALKDSRTAVMMIFFTETLLRTRLCCRESKVLSCGKSGHNFGRKIASLLHLYAFVT